MVQYLKSIYPQNSIESYILPAKKVSRYNWVYEVTETEGEYTMGMKRTNTRKVRILLNNPTFIYSN